ncbi:MAG: hypothetical protein ACOC93_04160 [Planctomycetota bacterium]
MNVSQETIAAQPSWVIESDQVHLAVTQLGGHMAPVTFYRAETPVQPYYISPWQDENRPADPPVLVPLRGDFFCMPFGGDNAWRGEDHTPHGETATARWSLVDASRDGAATSLTLRMDTHARPGRVNKNIRLVDGQNVVYVQHTLEGYSGPMSLGHHATLAVPETPRSMYLSTSPFRLGMTSPALFSNPAHAEYQALAVGREFEHLTAVPANSLDHPVADCSRFPDRLGYTDLIGLFKSPQDATPAWITAAVPAQEYLWFSLKDPTVLPATAVWISNRGRHHEPWCGRNRCLGLEDICGFFDQGLAASAEGNFLNEQGFPTAVQLSPDQPTKVNYVEGVVRIPRDFGQVAFAQFAPGRVTFTSGTGQSVTTDVQHEFVSSGRLS